MKNSFCHFFIPVFISLFCGCIKDTKRIYFSINPENRQIVIPVHLCDSITANMVFDSGPPLGTFYLDNTFYAMNLSCLISEHLIDSIKMGSAWLKKRSLGSIYKTPLKVQIGNFDFTYDFINSYNWKGYFNSDNSDGLFNISEKDTVNVWELNFEYNYLEIHSAYDFIIPKNCFIFQMQKTEEHQYPFNIILPMHIKCCDGDTLSMNRTFTVDTGMPWDIAIIKPAPELEFFNNRKDAVWTQTSGGYNRRFVVNATLFDNFVMDSLRIYTFKNSNSVKCKYIIGQNFLKRFNVFFDMKNKHIGLQPIKNFQRIVNPNHKRFYFSTTLTNDGKYIIDEVADYKENFYKTAGLRVGDEIISLNDSLYTRLNNQECLKIINTSDTLVLGIIRDGKFLNIIVPVDKNIEKGD